MVKELDYQKNRLILESWQVVRQQNDYHVQVGTSLYKKFFQRCPKAKTLFGWPAGMPVNSELLLKSKAYLAQSAMYIKLLDTVVDMLGPSTDMLTEILHELGERHWKTYNVSGDMYQAMGGALLETLSEILGDKFTTEVHDAWEVVWTEMSDDMMYSARMEYYRVGGDVGQMRHPFQFSEADSTKTK